MTDHRTPIAYKQLPDTDWCLIKTKDDCEFYYHWPTGQKSWDLPPELEVLMGDLIAQSMVWEGQDRETESKEAFMALLTEKVSPFGSFEAEMTRIAHDERFGRVSQRDQKALFDQFCGTRSAQLLEKKNAGLDVFFTFKNSLYRHGKKIISNCYNNMPIQKHPGLNFKKDTSEILLLWLWKLDKENPFLKLLSRKPKNKKPSVRSSPVDASHLIFREKATI